MTSCSRGDVVLVNVVFCRREGRQARPGLIVSIDRYHQGRREMILAAITSNVGRLLWATTRSKAGASRTPISLNRHRHRQDDQTGHDSGKLGELPAPELHTVETKFGRSWRSDVTRDHGPPNRGDDSWKRFKTIEGMLEARIGKS